MKKIIMLLMALCLVLPTAVAQNSKAFEESSEERVQNQDERIQERWLEPLWFYSFS